MSDRHPVVGSWRVSVDVPGADAPAVNLATLSLDGGVMVVFPSPTPAMAGSGRRLGFWSPAVGRWEATGASTARLSFMALGADENGAPIGAHTIAATATADAGGQSWSGPFTITIAGPDGGTLTQVSGTVNATRLTA